MVPAAPSDLAKLSQTARLPAAHFGMTAGRAAEVDAACAPDDDHRPRPRPSAATAPHAPSNRRDARIAFSLFVFALATLSASRFVDAASHPVVAPRAGVSTVWLT